MSKVRILYRLIPASCVKQIRYHEEMGWELDGYSEYGLDGIPRWAEMKKEVKGCPNTSIGAKSAGRMKSCGGTSA